MIRLFNTKNSQKSQNRLWLCATDGKRQNYQRKTFNCKVAAKLTKYRTLAHNGEFPGKGQLTREER